MTKEELKRLSFVVKAYQKIYPNNSVCGVCGLPWAVCMPKSVQLDETTGCFATCEYCWAKVTRDEVLKAHTEAYVDICLSMAGEDMDSFIEQRPLEYVLECVQQEYNKTHNQ